MSLLVENASGQQTLMQLPLACLLHRLDRAAGPVLPPDLGEVMLMDTGGRSASRDLDNIRWGT